MPPRGHEERSATEPDRPPAVRRRVIATPSPHDEQEEDGVASPLGHGATRQLARGQVT